ncbi:hypothetical protein SK128_027054 [Halocaridina rubra]|uniref:Uncharacterized protein n=1 Tax=Halocaridina rubra TaxID=373956 RepID=A0AAN8XME3_HALRR
MRKRGDQCPGPGCTAIEPSGDIIREVGVPYEAYCLFDPTHIDVSQVSFVHRGPQQYTFQHEVLNSSAIKVHQTHNTTDEYHLWCAVNGQHLCSRTVKIGYPPEDVKNFSCISKNWSELNCTWTAPDNPIKVKYHLTYVVPGFREQRYASAYAMVEWEGEFDWFGCV